MLKNIKKQLVRGARFERTNLYRKGFPIRLPTTYACLFQLCTGDLESFAVDHLATLANLFPIEGKKGERAMEITPCPGSPAQQDLFLLIFL